MKRPNYFSAKDVDEKWEEQENIVRMWRAVLDQVLQDLVYEGKGKEDKKAHSSAWEWLNETNEDSNFNLICDLADLDEKTTRKEIYKLMEKFYGSKYRRKLERSLEDIKRAKRERIRRQTN
jgi:hypothetical protein|tara:strand:- start:115 stop:477 length:363 start_codon:yes stop_codon:yes gene_type:complete